MRVGRERGVPTLMLSLLTHCRHRQLSAGKSRHQRRSRKNRRDYPTSGSPRARVSASGAAPPTATTGDLAFYAATHALEAAGVKASEIDLIVLGTTTPDLIFPSTACLLQHRLGANGCAAFDVNAACSGFLYALGVADRTPAATVQEAFVVGSETLSRMIDLDRSRDLRAVRRWCRRCSRSSSRRTSPASSPPSCTPTAATSTCCMVRSACPRVSATTSPTTASAS